MEKKWLPVVSADLQNRGLARYALKCLVIIYMAALRPYFRAVLESEKPTGSHFFLYVGTLKAQKKLMVEETDSVEGHYHVVAVSGFYN